MKKITMSDIIEELVRTYVIINKIELNEYVSKMNEDEWSKRIIGKLSFYEDGWEEFLFEPFWFLL